MAIHIGCGSWADSAYVGLLYPKGVPANARLGVYAQWFDRIELNATYHNVPTVGQMAAWLAQTPPNFLFDVKLPEAFSKDPVSAAKGNLTERLLGAVQPMIEAGKLGAFLLTLAPSLGPGRLRLDQLDHLVEKLRPHRLAVELRHRGWVEGDTLQTTLADFRHRELVWVALDLPRLNASALLPPLDEVTNPGLAYMRLHGRNLNYLKAKSAAERHEHDYTAAELEEIVARIRGLASRAKDVHVSVNNHAKNFAPKAAIALRRLLGQPVRQGLPPSPDGEQLWLPENT